MCPSAQPPPEAVPFHFYLKNLDGDRTLAGDSRRAEGCIRYDMDVENSSQQIEGGQECASERTGSSRGEGGDSLTLTRLT